MIRLGDYEILHALKSGGMGDVLLARRRGPAGFEQLCAIKTVRAELAATPVAREMFLDEARLLARLTHPGIAQILDFGEADGVAYMVMEYVAGLSFRALGDRRPPAVVVCQAVAEACRGLHAAHELRDLVDQHLLGVVHRDISPDNLMLGFDARVKVLDFGIALSRGRQAPVTELGTLKGKPPYMSPEQVKNLPIDRRSDVFSTAVVLWELVTGRPLFAGDSIYAVARAVEEQPIVAPSQLVPGLPDGIDDVILAGLERDPDRRLATAAAMAEVLERIAAAATRDSLEVWAERALAGEREHHRRWLAGVLGVGRAGGGASGRPSGVATAIDAAASDPITRGTTVGAPAPHREAAPSPPPTPEAPAAPSPRRRWLAAAVVLGGVAGGGLWLSRRDADDASAPPDAATDGVVVDAGTPPDPIDAEVGVVDAAPRAIVVDAARGSGRDASPSPRPPIDAAARPVVVDAAPMSVPVDAAVAYGRLAIGAWSPAARVSVDGVDWRETPVLPRKLPVGVHEVVLRSPLDQSVVFRTTVTIREGETVRVTPP